MKFLIKTQRGMEAVAANYIKDVLEDAKVWIAPQGYSGLVLVETEDKDAEQKFFEIPEIERAIPVLFEVPATIEDILSVSEQIAAHIKEGESFAVKTKRRGSHKFSSVDVNVALGGKIKELTNAEVDLTFPDKTVLVEIIGDRAYISITGKEEWKKFTPNKIDARKLFKKVTFFF